MDNDTLIGSTETGAILSPDGAYRYALWRRWQPRPQPACLFIGLNPSTADAMTDDQTIRRCRTLADTWGYGAILMGNLYAFRARQPADMHAAADPVGPDCDRWLAELAGTAALTVACWGSDPGPQPGRRRHLLLSVLPRLYVLGFTKDGAPRHPSRMPNIPAPLPWRETWTDPDMPCADCAHQFRHHHGEHGPCLHKAASQAASQRGKLLDGTVCPCNRFHRPIAA